MKVIGTSIGRYNNQPESVVVVLTQDELRRIVGGVSHNAFTMSPGSNPNPDIEICSKWDHAMTLLEKVRGLTEAHETLKRVTAVLGEHVVAPVVEACES